MQQIASAALRSRLASLAIFVISVIGFTLGPALVGWLSQYVYGADRLGDALQLVITCAMAASFILLALVRLRFLAYLQHRATELA
jgi:MFS family permease